MNVINERMYLSNPFQRIAYLAGVFCIPIRTVIFVVFVQTTKL